MSGSILCLAHVSEAGDALPKASYEVLGTALKLTKQLNAKLTIGLIGADVTAASGTVANAGAERILAVTGPDFATAHYASDAASTITPGRAAGLRADTQTRYVFEINAGSVCSGGGIAG